MRINSVIRPWTGQENLFGSHHTRRTISGYTFSLANTELLDGWVLPMQWSSDINTKEIAISTSSKIYLFGYTLVVYTSPPN